MEAASELGLDVLHHNADVGTWSNSGQYLATKLRTEDSTELPGTPTPAAIGQEGRECRARRGQ